MSFILRGGVSRRVIAGSALRPFTLVKWLELFFLLGISRHFLHFLWLREVLLPDLLSNVADLAPVDQVLPRDLLLALGVVLHA